MRALSVLIFLATTIVSSAAFAVPVQVTTNEFTTSWWWGADGSPLTREFGDAVIDVPEGSFNIRVGWEGGFRAHVDSAGNVTIDSPAGVGALGGQNSLEFVPVPVSVNTNGYDINYIAPGTGRTNGDSTIWVVPGTSGNYAIGLDHDTPGASLRFTVDAAGNVSPVNDHRGDYSVSMTGGAQQISFHTVATRIDPGAYTGTMRFIYDTHWYGARDLYFVKGTAMTIRFPYDGLRIDIEPDGTVVPGVAAAATFDGSTLTLSNSTVTVDPGIYDSVYQYYREEVGDYFNAGGIGDFVVVPGLRWALNLYANRLYFDVAADGTLSGANPATFDYDGQTLRIKTVPVTFDSGDFQFAWQTIFPWSDYPVRTPRYEGTHTFNLPPETKWRFKLVDVSGFITAQIDASGSVVPLPSATADSTASGLRLRTVTIGIDPGTYSDYWLFLRNVGLTQTWYGPQTFEVVPGLDYRISDRVDGRNSYTELFAVFEPCAVSAPTVSTDNATYAITCDVAPPDGDSDGVPDDADNCPDVANADQVDIDSDGAGDACDDDIDGDGVPNQDDNCPEFANVDQADADGDGDGNVCDSDTDGDSVPDDTDNCVFTANTDQSDNDADQLGDVCDFDDDNDGVEDTSDNCPLVGNPDQLDADGDAIGDACDADTDGDGVLNEDDLCAESSARQPVNANGCTGAQYIDLTCDPDAFGNHGRYVSCVAHAANDAVDLDLISPRDKSRFVKDAAKSKGAK